MYLVMRVEYLTLMGKGSKVGGGGDMVWIKSGKLLEIVEYPVQNKSSPDILE